jgi:GNAT superfamily N-acetyltransferase
MNVNDNIKIVPLDHELHLPQILKTQKELYSLNFTDASFVDTLYLFGIEGMYYRDDVFGFVMLDGEKVIGYYCYDDTFAAAQLMQIFIDSEYRGKGYGKILFEHFESEVKNNPDLYVIAFQVSAMNVQAVEFYKKHGYSIVDEETEANELRYMMFKEIKKFNKKLKNSLLQAFDVI